MSDTIGPTDHQLVARVSTGDVQALAELYDRHASLAYGIALGITRGVPSAEQAVRDTFTGLWTGGRADEPEEASIATWIARTARRRAIELTRDRQVHERPSPAQPVLALAALDDDERDVLQLACYGGRSEREIAASLEVPVGTIRSRMASALGLLRGEGAEAPC